jgi:integrase
MARPSFADLLKSTGRHAQGDSLYLTVLGPKSARWEFRMRFGKSLKSFWLGSAIGPAAIGLMDARRERAKKWLEFRGKEQPHKALARVTGRLFATALEEWLTANPKAWAEKSVKARRILAQTSLATLDVGKITQSDVLAALANETPRQHAEKRGWLADFFAYAKAQEWRSGDNPARFDADTRHGFAKVEKSDKHHAAVEWSDFPAVFKALPQSEVGNAVRFAALTVARAGEVENAKWSQIVSDNGHGDAWEYTIIKGGKPFEQRVPLTKAALDLIGERKADDVPLFALASNAMLNTLQSVRPDATVHGLRSTFNVWCEDQTNPVVDTGLIDAALAHYRGDKVRRAYARGDLFNRRRELMQSWSKFCAV